MNFQPAMLTGLSGQPPTSPPPTSLPVDVTINEVHQEVHQDVKVNQEVNQEVNVNNNETVNQKTTVINKNINITEGSDESGSFQKIAVPYSSVNMRTVNTVAMIVGLIGVISFLLTLISSVKMSDYIKHGSKANSAANFMISSWALMWLPFANISLASVFTHKVSKMIHSKAAVMPM